MRSNTSADKVLQFMARLGRRVRGAGSLYFTGGTTAVLLGWRDATMDIDLRLDPEPLGAFEAIAQLKTELDINIELASPADFIPTLPNWRERSCFIDTCGQIQFFHYDFYAQALSKLERAHAQDLLDVRELLQRGLIEKGELLRLFEAIAPGLLRFPSISPHMSRQRVEKAVTEGEIEEEPNNGH